MTSLNLNQQLTFDLVDNNSSLKKEDINLEFLLENKKEIFEFIRSNSVSSITFNGNRTINDYHIADNFLEFCNRYSNSSDSRVIELFKTTIDATIEIIAAYIEEKDIFKFARMLFGINAQYNKDGCELQAPGENIDIENNIFAKGYKQKMVILKDFNDALDNKFAGSLKIDYRGGDSDQGIVDEITIKGLKNNDIYISILKAQYDDFVTYTCKLVSDHYDFIESHIEFSFSDNHLQNAMYFINKYRYLLDYAFEPQMSVYEDVFYNYFDEE